MQTVCRLIDVDLSKRSGCRGVFKHQRGCSHYRVEENIVVQPHNGILQSKEQRMRLHICWGNYEGPHHKDIPLRDVINTVLCARPAGLSFEAANPRHEHEWNVFEDVKLPEGKAVIPGVLDSTTNYIEHPELVAQRLVRYARLVGR